MTSGLDLSSEFALERMYGADRLDEAVVSRRYCRNCFVERNKIVRILRLMNSNTFEDNTLVRRVYASFIPDD
jgi:hypothetical protein